MAQQEESRESSAGGFADQAQRRQSGLIAEVMAFLWHSKKWWLAPIIVLLAIAGMLVVLGGSTAAPFIYTLF